LHFIDDHRAGELAEESARIAGSELALLGLFQVDVLVLRECRPSQRDLARLPGLVRVTMG